MIEYNPIYKKNGSLNGAITTAPSNSLIFDLAGKAIWAKGVKLKGTDHTYTFSHDNYITLTNTPGSDESEDIKIGVNITTLKAAIDTTYSVVTASSNGLAPMFSSGNLADTDNADHYYLGIKGSTLKWYKNAYRQLKVGDNVVLGVTDRDPLQIVSADSNLSVTWNSTNKLLVIKNEKPAIGDLTDINVSQFKVTDNTNYRLLFKGTANDNNYTGVSRFSEYLLFNPSTKTLTIDGNIVLHSGNYLNYSDELSKILANLRASINSINTKITNFEGLETKVLTINGIGYNIYTSNPSLPSILALTSLGTAGLLLSSNGTNFTWIDDTIINNNINIDWNNETTIATIHNIPIKIKIPTNPNTWRNVRINNSNSDTISSNDTKPLIISQGAGIEVAYINDKIVITNTSPDINHNTHYTTSLYVGNNDDITNNALVLNPYIKLFDDNIRRSILQLVAGDGIRIQSENDGTITIFNNSIDNICKILAQLKGEIHSFNNEINSQLVNADIVSATNLYANNILLNNNQVVHTGNINHSLVTLANWNTEYIIATIAGIDIKIKTPINPISVLETKVLKINGVDYNIYTTETSLPQLLAPTHLGSNGLILSTNGNIFLWIDCPTANVTTSAILSDSNEGITHITETIANPYYNLLEGGIVNRSIRFLAGTGITISATVNGEITIANTVIDTNTDEKVKLIITTDNSDYRVLLKSSANNNEEITFSKFASTLTYNPNSKILKVDGLEVLHSGNYLKYTNEINQILAEIKGSIHNYEQFFDTSVLGVTNAYILYLNVFENAIFNNTITANGFIKNGGTSNQFLKADGSIDNTQYLPLIGGTLSGNLTGPKFIVLGGTSNDFLKGDGSLDSTTYVDIDSYNIDKENITRILATLYGSIKTIQEDLNNTTILSSLILYSESIVENGINIANKYLYTDATNGSVTTTINLLNNLTVTTTINDNSETTIHNSSWNKIKYSSIWDYIKNKFDSIYPNILEIEELDGVGYLVKDEHWRFEPFDNISRILATLKSSIDSVNTKILDFDTSNLGINNAYIDNLISNTGFFNTRPIVNGNSVLLNNDSMYIGSTSVAFNRSSAPLKITDLEIRATNVSSSADHALLLNTSTSNIWIYWDSQSSAPSSPQGILSNFSGNSIDFIKNGIAIASINLTNGSVIGQAFIKLGGTSSQFLKADGSTDSTVYIDETTYNTNQENLCKILASLKASIKDLRDFDTTTLGITNGYIQDLISDSGNFKSLKVNGTSVSLEGHTHDDRYFTETESNNRFVLKAGDAMTGNLTVPSLFINTGDATLKIYSGKLADGVSDGHIGLQTCIDALDGLTHSYASTYQAREVLSLQPRGGQVYIGNMPNGGNTNYKLVVGGNIYASSFVKANGTASLFLKADGTVDSTEYLSVSHYEIDLNNLSKVVAALQAEIRSVNSKIQQFDTSTLGINIAYIHETYVKTLQATEDIHARNFYSTSDIKKKQVIGYLSDYLYDVFNNSDGYLKQFMWKDSNKLSFGLIALEIQEFAPEAIVEDLDGYLHVNYNVALSKIVGALYRKIKEQEQMINELKNKIK